MSDDEEEFDDFEDASDNDKDEKEEQDVKSSSSSSSVWQPVNTEPELYAKLRKFYDDIPGETLPEEKIKRASTAYLRHQELLHFRLFKKYGVKLFDPAPLRDPEALKNPVGFYKKGATYTGKVSPFVLPYSGFIPTKYKNSTMKDLFNGISNVNSAEFMLRGKNYLEDGKKFPSKEAAFKLDGKGAFISNEEVFHCALNLPPLKKWLDKHKGAAESFFIQTWMIPGPPHFHVVNVWHRTLKRGEDKAFDLAYDRFCDADDSYRNSKLKYKVHFPECPLLVKGAIKTLGGDRPCIIGNKLKVHYHRGENYMECNINIGSSMIARNVAGVAMKQGGKRLIVDQTFLIEGQEIDELPERLIGGSRVTHIDLDNTCADYCDMEKPKKYVPGTESLAESSGWW
jgi:hypothetical protein